MEADGGISPGATRSALQAGQRVGDYVIERVLGSGSIGRVFRGRRAADDRSVAIKVLHPHLLRSSDARVRFVREAQAMAKVDHPSVGRIVETLELEGSPLLVLEYYDGPTLRALVDERGAFAVEACASLLRALTEALGAIHEAGWVHRDLKPENVIVLDPSATTPRDLRLLDFGLARSLAVRADSVRTAAGVFVGSLAYAAPEQLFDEELGPFTDWWALGVVGYELLTGRRPFEAPSRAKLAAAILRHETIDVPAGPIGAWVARRLSRAPESRGGDWRSVAAELP